MVLAGSLRNNDMAPINAPSQDDLQRLLVVFSCNSLHILIFLKIWGVLSTRLSSHEGGIVSFGNWAVSYWLNIMILKELNQLSLGVQRVKLDLVDSWFDLSISEQISD